MHIKKICQGAHGGKSVRIWAGVLMGLAPVLGVQAQSLGIASLGSTGGMVIPYAEVLAPGTLAATYGNYQEPVLGTSYPTHRNFSLGVGLAPHVEFFGRFADYEQTGSGLVRGLRDISANAKVQVPMPSGFPRIAVGLNDFAGGAVHFRSAYVVGTQNVGPLSASMGYASGSANGIKKPTFDGLFAGVNMRLTDNGLSALAEHEGEQNHLGLRWLSRPVADLGNAQLVGHVQRSYSKSAAPGVTSNTNSLAVSLVMPLGVNQLRINSYTPPQQQALPAVDARPADASPMHATSEDRMDALRKTLLEVGLERVRVGMRGSELMVEYENHRYGQNEVDALGLVFGLASELAPREAVRVHAITFKNGLRLYDTALDVAAYRDFLRDGSAVAVRDGLDWRIQPPDVSAGTQWVNGAASMASPLRVAIKPDLNYTLGTEIGAFDYALAADVQLTAPLWFGASAYATYAVPLGHSDHMAEGAPLAMYRQREGLKTVALQQSGWLGNRILAQGSVGSFYHGVAGAQAEATMIVPGRDDVIRLRGAAYQRSPGLLFVRQSAFAASYRWQVSTDMAIEAGAQRYSDGSRGPSVEWNRWFGDVQVQLFYRQGGDNRFAGLQLNIPLTPRRGMMPGPVFVGGESHHPQSIRTKLTSAGQTANAVMPGAVTDLRLDNSLDDQLRNAGRVNLDYLSAQLPRMREAFYRFGRSFLP